MIAKTKTRWLKAITVLLAYAPILAAAPQTSDVFIAGTGGYHTYRIPALLVTKNGTVLAFCEARKNSARDSGDIDLVARRSTDQGQTWSPMSIVHEEGGSAEITIGNPVPILDRRTGVVHLLFTRNNQRLFATQSKDDGQTWATPVEISEILRGFDFPLTRLGSGPGHGIQLRSLLAPIWLNEKIKVNYRSAVIYSDDSGKIWKAGGLVPPDSKDANECMLFERSDGAVLVNLRSALHRRSVAVSRDGGLSWSNPIPVEAMPDPVCQGSVLAIPARRGKSLVLFANAADERRRVNLTVRLSEDDGESWPVSRTVHAGPAAYSDLALARDGSVLCLYESGEKGPVERLRLVRFSINWLKEERR
jgi:sialidase-1